MIFLLRSSCVWGSRSNGIVLALCKEEMLVITYIGAKLLCILLIVQNEN